MRPFNANLLLGVLATTLLATPALAGPKSGDGDGGGGGRLGQVSSGIGRATGSQGGNSQSSRPATNAHEQDYICEQDRYYYDLYDERCRTYRDRRLEHEGLVMVTTGEGVRQVVTAKQPPSAKLRAYAGAQKVFESDGAVSLEVSVVDRRFRLDGGLTHYFEEQMDGGRLTMTMPSLTAGVRIDDLGPTGMWLQFGVVNAQTKDDAGDSTITGPLFGARVEHRISRKLSFLGTADAMFFKDDIKAYGGRLGLRHGHLQATFRIIDFNVGPALYGPEVGVAF